MKMRTKANKPPIVLRMLVCLAALGQLTAAVCAQSAGDPRNAATWYTRAISAWQQFKQNSPQQYDLITNYSGDANTPITPEIRAALIQVQGILGDMRKASQQEHCDFSLDYSQGFELMLPHLGEMRGIARAMKADVAVRLADGDTSGAAAELASMYRNSGHLGDDRVMISSLVGQAVFSLTDGAVQLSLDQATFNAADAATLLAAAKDLGTDDPFAYVEALGMEQEIALATFEKYRGEDGIKALAGLLGQGDRVEELAGYDDEQFDKALGQYDEMMTRVNAAFSMDDKDAAIAEITALGKACEEGEFGMLSMMMAPSFTRLLEMKFKGEAMVADRIASLEALASGAQKPEEAANAALWYLRAIDMWEALPAETRSAILGYAPAIETAPPAATLTALVDAQPAIEVFREATLKRRCDFSVFVVRRGFMPLVPRYAPGMHELQQVVRVDALRSLAAGEREAAVESLAMSLRAAAHLGVDANIACCRTAHVDFTSTLDLIENAAKAEKIDIRSAPQLADAAGRISRKDPFGYLDATSKTRETFTRQFLQMAPPDEAALKEWARQVEVIRQFNGDQVFFTLVMLDEHMRRTNDKGPPADDPDWQPDTITLPETIERLTGVIDPKAEAAIRAQYEEIIVRLNQNDYSIFVDREVTPAARIVDGVTRSRSDLRRATRLLMLPDEPEATKP